jgi:hypothetical protein
MSLTDWRAMEYQEMNLYEVLEIDNLYLHYTYTVPVITYGALRENRLALVDDLNFSEDERICLFVENNLIKIGVLDNESN